jgi:hypothetical protein
MSVISPTSASLCLAMALAFPAAAGAVDLNEIVEIQNKNFASFRWVKCLSYVTHGVVKRRADGENGPIFFAGRDELLPEEQWKPAVPVGEKVWVKCDDIERYEERPLDLKFEKVAGKPDQMVASFGSARVLCNSTKGIKVDGVLGGGGLWDNGERYSYDTPFTFLDAGGGQNALSFPNLVKKVREGTVTSKNERLQKDGQEQIRVVFQGIEGDQIAVWAYDLNPAHGMLPDEIRLTISTKDRTVDSQYLIRHRRVEGCGWFPMRCIRIVHSDQSQSPYCSIWRSEVKKASFEKTTIDDLKIALPRGSMLHLNADVKTQFTLEAPQIVDITAVDDLIHRSKLKASGKQ